LTLQDPATNRQFLDSDQIKPQKTVVVFRRPCYQLQNISITPQPIEDFDMMAKNGNLDGSSEVRTERPESLLQRYGIGMDHVLYQFLKSSRFFIIKSSNEKNIDVSQRNEEWATTTFNQDKLNKAYESVSNVIFFFSVNKSAHFQGMAKMISGLSSRLSRDWQNEGKF
jgi:hypothetical protein